MSDPQKKLVPRPRITGVAGVATTIGLALFYVSMPLVALPVTALGLVVVGCSLRKKQPQPIAWKNQTVQWKEGLTLSTSGVLAEVKRKNGDGELTFNLVPETPLEPTGKKPLRVEVKAAETLWYLPASKTMNLTVTKIPLVVTWPPLQPISYGTDLSAENYTTAIASAPAKPTYDPPANAKLAARNRPHDVEVKFTPEDADHYEVGEASNHLKVDRVTPVVAWPVGPVIAYSRAARGIPAVVTAAFKNSNVPGKLKAALGNPVQNQFRIDSMNVGVHPIPVDFIPDSDNFLTVAGTITITVTKVTPAIVWNPAPMVDGAAPGNFQLNARMEFEGWTVPGNPPVYAPLNPLHLLADVMNLGSVHTMTANLSPQDAVNYNIPPLVTVNIPVVLSPLQKQTGGIVGGIEGKLLHGTVDNGNTLYGAHSRDVLAGGAFTVTANVHIGKGVRQVTLTKNGSNPKDSSIPPPGWTNQQFLKAAMTAWDNGFATEVQQVQQDGSIRYTRRAQVGINGVPPTIEWKVVHAANGQIVAAYPTGL